jgi:hypothetical protein
VARPELRHVFQDAWSLPAFIAAFDFGFGGI